MIKLIVFDLDGVLVDTKDFHYEALNKALSEIDEKYVISYEEHIRKYDGLKTEKKLIMLTEEKAFPIEFYNSVWKRKQEITLEMFSDLQVNNSLVSLLSNLKKSGYTVVCCSNSIKKTILVALSKIGII